MPESHIHVQFQPTGKRVALPRGSLLIDAARWAGVELNSACGGEGSCQQCQVIVASGEVSERSEVELALFGEAERQAGRRLACCTRALSDVVAEIPRDSITTQQRLLVESALQVPAGPPIDPPVQAYALALQKPTLADTNGDFARLAGALRDQGVPALQADLPVLRSLPELLRQYNWQVTAFVRDGWLVGVGEPGLRPLGYCVDLGTTKIAVALVDLGSGAVLATAGAPNPQLGYGDDVISRINYTQRNPGGRRLLAEKATAALERLLGELLEQAGGRREQVVEGCIVANTAMLHLLLELPARQLVYAPYISAVSEGFEIRAAELGLAMAAGARLYFPPSVGGFIGSDHVAMMLACGLEHRPGVTLAIDIGTNSEIVLSKPGQALISSASCASGPAFEGAHIREGMRASSGAIEHVRLTSDGPVISTIQNEPPVGLCGSGIIDLAAELLRWKLINRQGTFQLENKRVRAGQNGGEFVLVPAEQSGSGHAIVIDQKDVNEIQLAKGAIHAGLQVLLHATGTQPEDVDEVIIAGAFGSYIDISQAVAIGLFPVLPRAHYRQVGNAALVGAQWMLISRQARRRADALRQAVQYVELTNSPVFNRLFAKGMLFPDLDGAAARPNAQ